MVRGKGRQDKDRTGVKNTRGNLYFQQLLYWQVGRIRVVMQHAVCVTIGDMKQRVSRRTLADRENRMCFNCLKPANTFHYSSVCRQPKCSVEGCGRRHHTMLNCDRDCSTEAQRQTTLSGFVASYNSKMQQTLLQAGTAMLVADSVQSVPGRVLFD